MISSPPDPDARSSLKRDTEWTGDKVHLPETGEPDSPNVITDVATAPAPCTDHSETAAIQNRLAVRGLLPREHIVDTADVTSDRLVRSQAQHGCPLLGPVAEEDSWQARQETGYAVAQFVSDWEAQQATCPEGKTSTVWKLGVSSLGHESVTSRFAPADCAPCPVRQHGISQNRPRALMIRRQPEFAAVLAARRWQTTAEFRTESARRAGVEGTISQGVRVCRLRRTRYRGLAKTAQSHSFIATALHLSRLAAWLAEVPRSLTPRSAFAAGASAA